MLRHQRLSLLPRAPDVRPHSLIRTALTHQQQRRQYKLSGRNVQHGHGSLPQIEGNQRRRAVLYQVLARIDGPGEQHHIGGGGEVMNV